jgi:chromosome segregation ATPase
MKCKTVIEALHAELEEEKLRYTELQQASKQAQSEVSILRTEVEAEKRKRKEIQSESNKLQSMSSDHDLKLQVIEKQRHNLERNLEQLKIEHRRARDDQTHKQVRIEELDHSLKSLQYKYAHETEELRMEILDLSNKVVAAEDEKGRLRMSLDQSIAESERAVRRLAEETELRNSRNDARAEEELKTRHRLETENRDLRQTVKTLESEIIRRAEAHSQKEVALDREATARVTAATDEVQTLNSQNLKLRGQAVAAEAAARDANERANTATAREAVAEDRASVAERLAVDTSKQLAEFRARLERTTSDFGRAIAKIEELQHMNSKAAELVKSKDTELLTLSEELIRAKMQPAGWDEERVARLRTKYEAKILKLRQKLVDQEEKQVTRQQLGSDLSVLSGGDEAWRRIVKEEVQAVARALMAPRN